jgi:serine/threonine kinase PknH
LAPEPLATGDPAEVAGYRLRGRLGAGGMGRVYLAFTPGGRPVALKVVRAELGDDRDFRVRFRQEIEAARRVHGLFTAQVLDGDPDGSPPWLVTAYVAGPSLARAVADHGPMPAGSVFLLMAGVAEALGAIHGAGVVHRDLKPSNVLLAGDGPRVIDFGIARAVEATALTRTGMRVGSPQYMSPEQVRGGTVTGAADVWALGALACYAATGRTPFGEGSQEAVLHRVLHAEPDLAGCPAALLPLIEACLAKDPADRPLPGTVIEACRERAASKTVEFSDSWLPPALAADLTSHAAPAPGPATVGPATVGPATAGPVAGQPVAPALAVPALAPELTAPGSAAPGPAGSESTVSRLRAGLANGGGWAGQVPAGDAPTAARTFPRVAGQPERGWRDLPRMTLIAAAAAALLLAGLVGYGAFILTSPDGPGGSRHPAADGNSPGLGARPANGRAAPASPSPSLSSSLDPCLFGTWTYTGEDIVSTIDGASVIYTGGAGITQSFQPDGITTLNDGDHGVYTTTYHGTRYTAINKGIATMHYQTQDGMLLLSDVSEHGTQEVVSNGVVQSSGPLTMNTEPERYSCSAETLRLYALNGSSVVETRDQSGS